MLNHLFRKLTDTSDGGKHLPWLTRKVMAVLSGFDADKYWKRRAIVVNPRAGVNWLLKLYYLLWIKRVDAKHSSSFGTQYNRGPKILTPPPDCPKSPRETETLRTPIQGQKLILDSH